MVFTACNGVCAFRQESINYAFQGPLLENKFCFVAGGYNKLKNNNMSTIFLHLTMKQGVCYFVDTDE